MKILLIDEDPCRGCADKLDDDYGRFCDIACGKYSVYLIKKEAYKAQLKKLIEYIDNKGGWTFPDDWDDIKKEVE